MAEVVFELLLKGPGYLFLWYVWPRKEDTDPDGFAVVATGIGLWLLLASTIGIAIYLLA